MYLNKSYIIIIIIKCGFLYLDIIGTLLIKFDQSKTMITLLPLFRDFYNNRVPITSTSEPYIDCFLSALI